MILHVVRKEVPKAILCWLREATLANGTQGGYFCYTGLGHGHNFLVGSSYGQEEDLSAGAECHSLLIAFVQRVGSRLSLLGNRVGRSDPPQLFDHSSLAYGT